MSGELQQYEQQRELIVKIADERIDIRTNQNLSFWLTTGILPLLITVVGGIIIYKLTVKKVK